MWMAKLLLTTLFTEENAFISAFASVSRRLGITQISGLEDSYNPIAAIVAVLRTLFQSPAMLVFIALLLLLFVVVCVVSLKPDWSISLKTRWNRSYVYLCLALIPGIWYVVTCSPTVLHAFFQYRGLAVSIFSGLIFVIKFFQNDMAVGHPVGKDKSNSPD
jgi:hypothetical protein